MYRKLKVKIVKQHKNLFYVVIALNKKSIRSHFIDKIGVCFFNKKKKIVMLSLKKLSLWLNKGVQISNLVSYLFSRIFSYNIENKEKNEIIFADKENEKKKLVFDKYNLKKKKKIIKSTNQIFLNYISNKKI